MVRQRRSKLPWGHLGALIVGVVFAVLLGAIACRIWSEGSSHGLRLPRWRVVTAATVFSAASIASACISGVALFLLLRKPGRDEAEPRRPAPPVSLGSLGRPFHFGLCVQGVLLFLASMILDCGMLLSSSLFAFALWDIGLGVVRRRLQNLNNAGYALAAMLGPALIFWALWQLETL